MTQLGSGLRRNDEKEVAHLADLAEQAARLCKADLVSATVGEFPEVQGIAGRYLALAEGLPVEVADAIRDHYKPVGQGDDVPTAPVSIAVALADKLDTLFSFFVIDERPTGSRDPFALRRAALGILSLMLAQDVRADIEAVYRNWAEFAGHEWLRVADGLEHVRYFLADRLKVQQREAGIRPDIIDAVFALGGEDDLVRLLARVRALQAFVDTDDGANLLAGYRRAANILRDEEKKDGAHDGAVDAALLTEPAERALSAALDVALPKAAAAVAAEDFAAAMTALAGLRAAVDAFFAGVVVNAEDLTVRCNRLNLLNRLRQAVHTVADFGKIERQASSV